MKQFCVCLGCQTAEARILENLLRNEPGLKCKLEKQQAQLKKKDFFVPRPARFSSFILLTFCCADSDSFCDEADESWMHNCQECGERFFDFIDKAAHTDCEPGNSYFGRGRRLVIPDVEYTLNPEIGGTLASGKRFGTLIMERGLVEARRIMGIGSSEALDRMCSNAACHQLSIKTSELHSCTFDPASISISSIAPCLRVYCKQHPIYLYRKAFRFKSQEQCKQFEEAFNATKDWMRTGNLKDLGYCAYCDDYRIIQCQGCKLLERYQIDRTWLSHDKRASILLPCSNHNVECETCMCPDAGD